MILDVPDESLRGKTVLLTYQGAKLAATRLHVWGFFRPRFPRQNCESGDKNTSDPEAVTPLPATSKHHLPLHASITRQASTDQCV